MHLPQSFMRLSVRLVTGLLMAIARASMADCDAHSGERAAALVELYTSEGCSSCPPADRALGALAHLLDANAEVVPLALHVTYWDELGWQDHYARAAFDERQQWLVTANHQTTVYTPQFFVAGREVRDWRARLREEVRHINESTAGARIRVQAQAQGDATLALHVAVASSTDIMPAALYLALTESGLSSSVSRGENGGHMLSHDHVVRTWIGPLSLTQDGLQFSRDIALDSNWNRARLGLVAFVQNTRSGRVLQALGVQQCAAS